MRVIESSSCEAIKGNDKFAALNAYKWLAKLVGSLYVADQLSKFAAIRIIEPYHTLNTPLGPILRFTLIFNDGAAFGILSGKLWLIIAISVIMASMVLVYWRKLWGMGKIARIASAVVLAGSLGNLTDRIRLGNVIDFIEVPIVPLFQVFNFADAFIVLGSLVFIYAIFRAS
jgi:signal peptidase II